MITNIEDATEANKNYRKVIYTTKDMQLVLMNIPYREEIGSEVHQNTTQFIRVEKGHGVAVIKNKVYNIYPGDAIVVPPKTKHNIISLARNGLKLYTLYSPPEHRRGLTQRTKPV